MIITIASPKGGTAKSTTTATLARLWVKERPVVLDTDRLQTINRFKLKGVQVMDCRPGDVCEVLKTLPGRLVLIDCPPDPDVSYQALRAAHLIVLPAAPEPFDLGAAFEELEKWNRHRPTRLLFTRCVAGDKPIMEAAYRKYNGLIFSTRINRSSAVVEAARRNLTVIDYAPNNIAARQYRRLGQEIMSHYANNAEAE